MKAIFPALVLLLSLAAQAQTITVRDNISSQPLEDATVSAAGSRASAVTDAGGRADCSAFADADSIRIQLIGYRPATAARAQWSRPGFTVYLERAPLALGDVVVSATRWKQPERDVPERSVRVREADAQLANPQTAADLLASSGEVAVQKSQLAGGSPMIRGFATNRVLIAVDGVRMNTAIFRSGNVQNVISLDPQATERTEVLFGPGSVMYGSDAIGGVMSFTTLTPRLSQDGRTLLSGHAALRGSTANGEKTGHADLLIGLDRWGFATSVTYSDFGNLVMGSHGPDAYLRTRSVERINGVDSIVTNADAQEQVPSGYSQVNLLQKIRFRPSDAWDFTYGAQYSATSDYARYDRLLRPKGSLLRSAEWYYGPQIWMLHSLTATNRGGSALWDEAGATAAYQYFKESRHDRDYRKTTKYHRTERVDAYSANLDFTKAIAPAHGLSYGAELLLNRVGSTGEDENVATGAVVPGATRYPDGATWSSLAAYAGYRWAALEALSLQAGLRVSRVTLDADFDTTFYPFPFTSASMRNSAVNGSLGAVLTPMEALRFTAVLSTGFRAPNVDDAGKVFDSSPGYVVVPNPDLKPEYAYNAELGMTVLLDDVLKLDLTGFYTLLRDALVKRNFTLNGRDSILYDGAMSRVQAMQNAAKAYVRGVQARAELRLPAGFGLSSHLTAMRGTEQMDDGSTGTLRHAPPVFGSTHLTYTRHRLEVDCYADYSGEVSAEDLSPGLEGRDYLYALDGNGRPYAPSWYTLNIKARVMILDALQLTAGVENLTDQRYRTYASGITAAGRNVIAALRFAF
jgi:hemoglobin/transferrin/lactoferrin receptor protein